MLVLIAAASVAVPAPTPSSVTARAFVRIERAALANAQEWTRPSNEVNRRERIVKDERGALQLQRVFDYE